MDSNAVSWELGAAPRHIIEGQPTSQYFDTHVGTQFVGLWRRLKTGKEKRLNNLAIEVTEAIRRLFGYRTLDISASEDGTTLHLYIDGKPFRLSEMGAGLTQFIIILTTAAAAKPPYIFIDEPELHLHPTLQIEFVLSLASFASKGVFFATHSLGLARAVSNKIYSVGTREPFQSQVRPYEEALRLSEVLGELSFRGYKDVGYSTLLLVEGPSDLATLQQFLRHFNKEHKVVMLSMNGTNLINGSPDTLTQLEEVTRISDRVSAVIDSERTAQDSNLERNRLEFQNICSRANITCHVLERRSIEHYLTDRAIKAAMGPNYRGLTPFEARTAAQPTLSKRDNWKAAREMTKEELNLTDLGEFLRNL